MKSATTKENATTTKMSAAKLTVLRETETKTRTFYYPYQNKNNNNLTTMESLTKTQTLLPVGAEEMAATSKVTTAATNAKHFLPQLLKNRQSQNHHSHQRNNEHFQQQHELQLLPTTNTQQLLQPIQSKLFKRPLSSSAACYSVSTKLNLRESSPTCNIKSPLFEVQLELVALQIRFQPTFDSNVENNFQQIVEQLLEDINTACSKMPRIFRDKSSTISSDDEYSEIYVQQNKKAETKCHDLVKKHKYQQNMQQQLVEQKTKIKTADEVAAERKIMKEGTRKSPTMTMTYTKCSTLTTKGIFGVSFLERIS